MPKKNFEAVMINLIDGQPLTEPVFEIVGRIEDGRVMQKKTGDEDVTYKLIARRALCSEKKDENISKEKKNEYGAIAIKLLADGDIDLTSKEIATIRDRVGELMPPMHVAQMNVLLDAE